MPQLEKETSSTPNRQTTSQQEHVEITRSHERRRLSVPGNPVRYDEITPPGKSLAMFTVTYEPGQNTGAKFLRHGGDESLLVLKGTFELELEDKKIILETGDSAFIPRGACHRITNVGSIRGEGVFVLTPPEYSIEGEH